jgi:rhodanese-related sulfurtransferase
MRRILLPLARPLGLVVVMSVAAAAPVTFPESPNSGAQSIGRGIPRFFWKDIIGWPYDHTFSEWPPWAPSELSESPWMSSHSPQVQGIAKQAEQSPEESAAAKPMNGQFGYVSASMLERMMRSHWGGVVVDLGAKATFQNAHIAGAINIPEDQIAALAPKEIPDRSRPIVVYCGSLGSRASIQATREFRKLGYQNVYDYRGGLKLWAARGYPTTGAQVAHR